jgi:hypothetical protein
MRRTPVYAYDVRVYGVQACEMHVYEAHAHEMHCCEVHVYRCTPMRWDLLTYTPTRHMPRDMHVQKMHPRKTHVH